MHMAAPVLPDARRRRRAGPSLSVLTILVAAAAAGACASGGGGSAATAAAAPAPSAAAAIPDSEERAAYERAERLRNFILQEMVWTELGGDSCRPGDFRSYGDTTFARATAMADSVARLERLIIVNGAEDTLDTPSTHDLLRTVIGWETGVERPLWDVLPTERRRREAIGAGLTGSYVNPQTGKCDSLNMGDDTVTVILPPVTNFTPPALGRTVVTTFVAESGLGVARERFYAARGRSDPNALFTYLRISALVPWRDYAVVAVNRPAEARGILSLPQSGGGATYLFHRVGREWRLLSIVRTWA
jgi:hypothetical protein